MAINNKIVILRRALFCPPKDLGDPRDASRSLRSMNRAFGSLPYSLTTSN